MSATPIEFGAMARTTRKCQSADDARTYAKAMEFEVEDYISAEDADDGKAFYYGSNNGGMNNVCVFAEDVELVRSAAEMRARTIPSPAEIAEHIASESLGGWGGLEIDEADYAAKDGSFEVYGKSADGLRFAAIVKVLRVEQADF